jgi:hypothetical protein
MDGYTIVGLEPVVDEAFDDGGFPHVLISEEHYFVFDFSAHSR